VLLAHDAGQSPRRAGACSGWGARHRRTTGVYRATSVYRATGVYRATSVYRANQAGTGALANDRR
jgi:hypothetical protein